MSRVEDLWERLVRAALRGRRAGVDLYGRPEAGLAAIVPSSLGNRDIDDILRAADEIQDDDPNVSRILCEHAYSLAQNLDPNSEGRGVLQFKTGLMSVIKQKLAKREGGSIDRSQDIARLREFYKRYREKHDVDKLREEELKLRESGVFSGNLGELEHTTVKRKRVLATLKVLGNVLEQLTKDVSPEEADRLIPDEIRSLDAVHQLFEKFPTAFMNTLHVPFPNSVSSLASFMSNQETSFVTLGQRVLANPLKCRMHYGHPDVFDRVFHITRGGISKASRVINISEDIYSGFNSTLRQGNVTHHEYIQVGKGRDVGLNQIALFEGKVAGGNGEQVLSRDVYRLGQLFDFFRMLSFYFTTVGYYFCTMLTVLTVYAFLYGRVYLALSGVGETIQDRADILQNTALNAALNAQFLFQIGVFTAVPMVLGFILEEGFLRVYGYSWIAFAVIILLFKVFGFSQKISVNFQLLLRFIQGLAFLVALVGLAVAVAFTKLSIVDIFACLLAFLPTGWGILSIACAWKPLVKKIGLWKSMRSIARLYDAAMGILIFIPIALLSWFPFVSTFQTRLMFNQAFSRGLEISLILAGNNPNTGI
ncbi:UNVERIFIED_CONTAM: Callose synthase 9 [Sesamum radiatum]|uniref:Callose synthase 9 n=1 Tax=Sesamum radiatum TaxID=300843 RepID=A0AAW2W7L8_SESRA